MNDKIHAFCSNTYMIKLNNYKNIVRDLPCEIQNKIRRNKSHITAIKHDISIDRLYKLILKKDEQIVRGKIMRIRLKSSTR